MSKRIILSIALSLGLALSLSTSAFAKMEDKDVYFGGSAKETSAEFVQMRIRGTLSELPSTTLPTTITITSGGKPYLVNISSSTVIVRRFNGKSTLTEFAMSDDVEVVGKTTDSGNIQAKILKNHSIYLTNTKGVFGNIKSIDAGNNTLVFNCFYGRRQGSGFNLGNRAGFVNHFGGLFQKINAVSAHHDNNLSQIGLGKRIIYCPALRSIAYFQISELGLGFDSRNDDFSIGVNLRIVIFIFPGEDKSIVGIVN